MFSCCGVSSSGCSAFSLFRFNRCVLQTVLPSYAVDAVVGLYNVWWVKLLTLLCWGSGLRRRLRPLNSGYISWYVHSTTPRLAAPSRQRVPPSHQILFFLFRFKKEARHLHLWRTCLPASCRLKALQERSAIHKSLTTTLLEKSPFWGVAQSQSTR